MSHWIWHGPNNVECQARGLVFSIVFPAAPGVFQMANSRATRVNNVDIMILSCQRFLLTAPIAWVWPVVWYPGTHNSINASFVECQIRIPVTGPWISAQLSSSHSVPRFLAPSGCAHASSEAKEQRMAYDARVYLPCLSSRALSLSQVTTTLFKRWYP